MLIIKITMNLVIKNETKRDEIKKIVNKIKRVRQRLIRMLLVLFRMIRVTKMTARYMQLYANTDFNN